MTLGEKQQAGYEPRDRGIMTVDPPSGGRAVVVYHFREITCRESPVRRAFAGMAQRAGQVTGNRPDAPRFDGPITDISEG